MEVVREWFEARNRGDRQAMLALIDRDCVYDLTESDSPYRGTYSGHAEISDLWEAVREPWSEYRWAMVEPVVVGDRVVVTVDRSARGRASGIETTAQGANLVTVRHGRIVHLKLFQTRAEADAAVEAR